MVAEALDQVLPDNPLKKFSSYTTYFTIKFGRGYTGNSFNNVRSGGHDSPSNILLLDTRGQSQGGDKNQHPKLSVKHFDISHFFNDRAEATFGLDATLRIFERGGASYLQEIGRIMQELEVSHTSQLVMWVGVGLYGWRTEGKAFTAEPISQKWFPLHIFKVDMNLRNSGSEYTHWLRGWTYVRTAETEGQQINDIHTVGATLGDHLNDLMVKASSRISRTAEESARSGQINQAAGQENNPFKKITYSFELGSSSDGSTIKKDAQIVSDTTTMNTGGLIDIHSGGESGITTIVNHIKEILAHCPTINQSLIAKNQSFKIIARPTVMNEEEESITYNIFTYSMDSRGLKPLKRFNYFFGGRNEDVIEFNFNLDGLFKVIPNAIVDSTRNTTERDHTDTAQGAEERKESADLPMTSATAKNNPPATAFTVTNRKDILAKGDFPPLRSKLNWYRNNTVNAQRSYLQNLDNVEAWMGPKLLEGGFKIIGDPNLILDEATIAELQIKGAPLETAINYIIFTVGIPGPEFPNIPETENFIFNGVYGIRSIKSIFDETGKFTQEINVFFRADLTQFGGNITPDPNPTRRP